MRVAIGAPPGPVAPAALVDADTLRRHRGPLVRGRGAAGRLQLIATIVDPRTIRALLLSLGVRAEVAERAPPVVGAPA